MSSQSLIERWKSEGYTEGLQTGRIETVRMALLRVVELRFAQLVPAERLAQINAETNADTLSHWLDEAITAPTLDWFGLRLLQPPVPPAPSP